MRWLGMRWVWALLLLGGCGSCDGVADDLRVDAPHPYVHCAKAAPLEARRWRVGETQLALEGRRLKLEPAGWPLRIAAFAGPGFSEVPPGPALEKAMAAHPDVVLMIGGLGDTAKVATRMLGLLAQQQSPSLVLAGGRDQWNVWQEAFESLDEAARARVIDATRLESVIVRDNRLHLLAGAVDGRYARNADACGLPSRALASREAERTEGMRDWLIAWQAPASSPSATRGPAALGSGLQAAPAALTKLASRLDAPGGLFASPHFQVMRPFSSSAARMENGEVSEALRLVVPRLVGPVMERADGSRVPPGFALLELGDKGLKLLAGPGDE